MILLFLCLCLSFSYEYTKYKTSGRIKLGITLESCSQGDYIIVEEKDKGTNSCRKVTRATGERDHELLTLLATIW